MTSSLSSILPPFSLHNTFPLLGLITSTGALTYAYAEIVYLTPLTDERVPEHVIRTSWEHSFYPGLGAILTLGAGSLVGGITGYKMAVSKAGSGSGSGSMAKVLYATGTVLSMVHFVFVPWIAKTIEAMLEPDDEKKQTPNTKRQSQKRWLRLHYVRTLVSDIPAFVAFLGATSAYFLS